MAINRAVQIGGIGGGAYRVVFQGVVALGGSDQTTTEKGGVEWESKDHVEIRPKLGATSMMTRYCLRRRLDRCFIIFLCLVSLQLLIS